MYDYNAYLDCTGTYTPETNDVDNNSHGNPFKVEYYLNWDADAVDAGKTDLGSPYNSDGYYGKSRDTNPDIGASEYTSVVKQSTMLY